MKTDRLTQETKYSLAKRAAMIASSVNDYMVMVIHILVASFLVYTVVYNNFFEDTSYVAFIFGVGLYPYVKYIVDYISDQIKKFVNIHDYVTPPIYMVDEKYEDKDGMLYVILQTPLFWKLDQGRKYKIKNELTGKVEEVYERELFVDRGLKIQAYV